MVTLVKPTTQRRKPQWSVWPRQSHRSGGHLESAQILLLLGWYILGAYRPFHTFLISQLIFRLCRLTAAKEAGASIEIDGKKVALGIPQAPGSGSQYPGIPLNRGGTVDEAAAAMLLCVLSPHLCHGG